MNTPQTQFFVELPEDEYGNTAMPRAVIEAWVERFNDGYRDRERLHVIAPHEHAHLWPTHLRDVWLPGGMPYYVVSDTEHAE